MNTKIIATVGPKSESTQNLEALLNAGVDIVRVNFSHATYEQYVRVKKIIDRFNKKSKRKISIIADLQGPRIRIGKIAPEGITLHDGDDISFCFSRKKCELNKNIIPIDNSELHLDIKKGEPLYLSNGEIEILVTSVKNEIISGKILNGGLLTSHKGINVPYTNLKRGGLTPKDVRDVKFVLGEGADYIALSFVQTAEDVEKLRRLLDKKSKIKIISKIERAIALKNIDSIIVASDLIMIARGDLGIEIPIEDLPIVQKNLVRHSHWHDKPAIIATQVMTSMITNAHPTRAEVSDIANAVFEGADLIMLSDETTIGAHPLEAVKILSKVIKRIERSLRRENVNI